MSPPRHHIRKITEEGQMVPAVEEESNAPDTIMGKRQMLKGGLRTLITSPEDESLRKRGRRRYRQDRKINGGTATATERSPYNPSNSCLRGNE